MGQLEKYGLYVLCLVIFLILGVTIWGGGDLPTPINKPSTAAIKAASGPAENQVASRDVASMDLAALLRSADRSAPDPKKNSADPKNSGDPKRSTDPKKPADSNKSGATGGPSSPVAKHGGEARDASDAHKADPPKSTPTSSQRPTHKVRSKDTFEGIAKEVLGNAALRTEIARLNAGVDPTKLKVGQELLLPTAAEIAQWNKTRSGEKTASTPAKGKEASATPGVYTVVKGDTFERIAAAELGSKKRVNELLELNPTIHPRELTPGQKIKLPKK
jgi:nucleoid-associated protein YgaU